MINPTILDVGSGCEEDGRGLGAGFRGGADGGTGFLKNVFTSSGSGAVPRSLSTLFASRSKASRRILPAGTAKPQGSRCGLSPDPGRVRALPRHRVSRARKRHARSRGISQKISRINSRGSASFQFNAHRTGRMTACLTCASLRNRPERSSPTALLNVCSGFTVEIPQLVSPTPVQRARVRVKVDNHAFSL